MYLLASKKQDVLMKKILYKVLANSQQCLMNSLWSLLLQKMNILISLWKQQLWITPWE